MSTGCSIEQGRYILKRTEDGKHHKEYKKEQKTNRDSEGEKIHKQKTCSVVVLHATAQDLPCPKTTDGYLRRSGSARALIALPSASSSLCASATLETRQLSSTPKELGAFPDVSDGEESQHGRLRVLVFRVHGHPHKVHVFLDLRAPDVPEPRMPHTKRRAKKKNVSAKKIDRIMFSAKTLANIQAPTGHV